MNRRQQARILRLLRAASPEIDFRAINTTEGLGFAWTDGPSPGCVVNGMACAIDYDIDKRVLLWTMTEEARVRGGWDEDILGSPPSDAVVREIPLSRRRQRPDGVA